MKLKKCLISRGTKKAEVAGITGGETFGVAGMGGIGKTTLAKSLYQDEDIKNYYDHRIYWVAIKKRPNIVECQRSLIYDICKEMPVDNLNSEKLLQDELKKNFIKMKKVLLFLDDVWEKEHVDRLLGESFIKTLPPGSKCVITSRKPAKLGKLDMKVEIEKLDLLNDKDSKMLFYHKASLPDKMDEELQGIVIEVIHACGNMPILLATVGAERWGKRGIHLWEKVRERLKELTIGYKSNQDNDLNKESAKYQKLIEQVKISYDDLPESDAIGAGINFKDYFLDFAIFPEREEIEIAMLIDMWIKPGLSEDGAYMILEQLEQRSLVRIVGYWCYVHDIFRALAIKLVEESSVKRRKRLFVWGVNDRLPKQWLSEIVRSKFEDASSNKDEKVFDAEKMVIARSDLKQFHPDDSLVLMSLAHLRVLILTSNLNLVSIPTAIGCLKILEKLDVSWCLGLESLPHEVGQLKSLQKLNLAGCCSLNEKIPPELGNLGKLLELNMQSCGISELPPQIGNLTSLTYLCLNDCIELQVLPEEMGKLGNLEKLECDMLWIAEIPETLGNLIKLKKLSFGACGRITKFPAALANLKRLVSSWCVNCTELEIVPDELDVLVTKGSLKEFNIYNTRVVHKNLPVGLRDLPKPFDGVPPDAEVEATPENPEGLYWSHRRGQLVDPTSLFDPSNKEERQVSFGLARMVALARTEPFMSPRFTMAIRIIYTMANYDGTRHTILKYGGIPILLRCVDEDDPNGWCSDYAASTLCNICVAFSTHKAIVDARGLEILTRALNHKNHISYSVWQALSWIIYADKREGDYTFTSEIYERCGHSFGHLGCACIWCQHKHDTFLSVRDVF